MPPNIYILAADNSPALLPLLRENPNLASQQDEHGYSLVHAAASYNHLDLLRALIREFKVDVNIRDEDNETALFVVETVEAARVLIEELDADLMAEGSEGFTARQKIEEEGDYPDVVEYLMSKETEGAWGSRNGVSRGNGEDGSIPAPPAGLNVNISTMAAPEENETDAEFRRAIEELVHSADFHSEENQAALRQMIEEAIAARNLGDRNVRPRQD